MIYFVEAEGVRLIKIGYTHEDGFDARLATLQVWVPIRLNLIGTMPGTEIEERKLHARFGEVRSHGEWFWPSRELLDFIREQTGKDLHRRAAKPRPHGTTGTTTVNCEPAFKHWLYQLVAHEGVRIAVMADAGFRLIATKRGDDAPPELAPEFCKPVTSAKYHTDRCFIVQANEDWRIWVAALAEVLGLNIGQMMRLGLAAYARSIGFKAAPLSVADSPHKHLTV